VRTARLLVAAALITALAALLPTAPGADDRAPVPEKAAITKAEAVVKDVFKAEYAKTKAADRKEFAAKLLEQAGETKDDLAARYVLLRDARDLAARAGDADGAMKAAEEMAAGFRVSPGEAKAAAADLLVTGSTTPALASAAAQSLLDAADAARAAEDWAPATTLAKAAEAAARKAQSAALANAARAKLKEIDTFKSESEKVKDHVATLEKNPDDPTANLAVGRFRCLVKNDWEGAVPLLVKGPDAKLKAAAEKDLKAAAGADADKLASADAWYELAGASDPALKAALQQRARHWYTTALPGLTGLNKAKAEKRVAELSGSSEPKVGPGPSKTNMFALARKAVADKQRKEWEIVGGGFRKDTFEEVPKEGAILIGFHYTTTGGGKYPGVVQPIWLTARGEVKGRVYGVPDRGAVPQTVKAKPGYAVGALYVRGGGGFDAFQPIFMKITDKGLDPNEKYEGTYVGGKGGGEGTVGGDGNFIVGIHGKIDLKRNTRIQALSIVTINNGDATESKLKKPWGGPSKAPRRALIFSLAFGSRLGQD
jgi:hypothetical protein